MCIFVVSTFQHTPTSFEVEISRFFQSFSRFTNFVLAAQPAQIEIGSGNFFVNSVGALDVPFGSCKFLAHHYSFLNRNFTFFQDLSFLLHLHSPAKLTWDTKNYCTHAHTNLLLGEHTSEASDAEPASS